MGIYAVTPEGGGVMTRHVTRHASTGSRSRFLCAWYVIEQSIELDCHVVLETPETTAMRRPRVRRMRRQLGGGGSQKRHRQVEARQELDLLAPLAAEYAEEIACLHIPPTFLTSATAARQAWIHELSRADRLLLVTGLSVGKLGRRCSWLVVSKQAGGWRHFLRHDHPRPAAWIPLNISRHQPGWGVQVHERPGKGEATRELGATPRTPRGVATAVTPGEGEFKFTNDQGRARLRANSVQRHAHHAASRQRQVTS
ncbi:hypothetical protein NFJ02_35g88580 [Pycnococcus provasolii]